MYVTPYEGTNVNYNLFCTPQYLSGKMGPVALWWWLLRMKRFCLVDFLTLKSIILWTLFVGDYVQINDSKYLFC